MVRQFILTERKLKSKVVLIQECVRWEWIKDPHVIITELLSSCGIYVRYRRKFLRAIRSGFQQAICGRRTASRFTEQSKRSDLIQCMLLHNYVDSTNK